MQTDTTPALTAEQAIARARALLWLVRRQYEPDAPQDADMAQPVLLAAEAAIEHARDTCLPGDAIDSMAGCQLRALAGSLLAAAWQFLERGPSNKPSATEREDFTTACDVAIELADAVLAALGRVQAEGARMVQ